MAGHPSDSKIMIADRFRTMACLFLGGALLLSGLPGCSGEGETDRIRSLVSNGVIRAEKHDVTGLMEMTVEGFRADPGDRDRPETAQALAGAFLYYGRFRLLHPRPVVEMSSDSRDATVTVPFLIVRWNQPLPDLDDLRDDPAGWLSRVGEQADLYHLKVHLKKTGGSWQAVSAHLQPFRGLSLNGG